MIQIKDNKQLIKNLSIWGAIFTILMGSLLHFVYDWSGKNFIVGLLTPVNESPWEHMKLAFTPLVMFSFLEFFYLRSIVRNLCFALFKEVVIAISFILGVFYIYTFFVEDSILAIDIGSFIVGVTLAKWIGYLILTGKFKKWEFKGINTLSMILMFLLTAFFVYTTINPPRVHLFFDGVTNTHGIFEKK